MIVCPNGSDGRGRGAGGQGAGGRWEGLDTLFQGVPFPPCPGNDDGDVLPTHTTNAENKEETNKELDWMKRRSSVVPPLVQPTIVLLS